MPAKRTPARRAAKAAVQASSPNQFHLAGEGVAVSYYPDGVGPVRKDGPICLIYQDAARTLSFTRNEVRADVSPDIGTIVSVTLSRTVDLGSTSFSLLVPDVRLPEPATSAAIHTVAVTTVHRTFLFGPGPGQQQTYTTTELSGDARLGPLPM
jgi:hypothetical protein